jgi:aconitate hydratase
VTASAQGDTLDVAGAEYEIYRLDALQSDYDVARLPYSLKVLLENALRLEDGESVSRDDVEAIARWDAEAEPSAEIPFQPRARADAGLHRRARARRPRGDARRDGDDLGGRPGGDQPARRPSTSCIDHSGPGRRLRQRARLRAHAERDF